MRRIFPMLFRMLSLKTWRNSLGRQTDYGKPAHDSARAGVCRRTWSWMMKSVKLTAYNTASLPWEYCTVAERGSSEKRRVMLDVLCVETFTFCWILNDQKSVWDFVKFSNINSMTLNEIRRIKMWFEQLSASYRLLLKNFMLKMINSIRNF